MQSENAFPERGMNDLFAELWSVYLARILRLLFISVISAAIVFGAVSGIDVILPEGNQPAIDEILTSVPEGETLTSEQLQQVAELQLDDLPLEMLRSALVIGIALLVSAIAAGAYMFVIGAHYVVGRVLISEALTFSVQRVGGLIITTLMALAVVFAVWALLFIAPFMIANAAMDAALVAALFGLLSFTGFVGALVITAYVAIRWTFIWPVIAFEGVIGVTALRRSWELTENFWWRTFGIVVIITLAVFAVGFPGFLATGAGLDTVGTWYSNIVAPTLAGPIQAIMIFLLYSDLRTRKEVPPGYGPDQIASELNFQTQAWDDAP
ncbi:MAG: glycerophosphoryl diester phosphodiesterase membrane domain-containing protein [Chloroflexi bacterium]|nr:glycerophosphoryl diester phosphodiesterase membrane domain-containing protein [Chloroflexota bacterium]